MNGEKDKSENAEKDLVSWDYFSFGHLCEEDSFLWVMIEGVLKMNHVVGLVMASLIPANL